MSNYGPHERHEVGHFSLDFHPYAAAPDNRFDGNAALQYGADFKVGFQRQGTHAATIGLVQLILPRTQVFQNTRVGEWNVDKRAPGNEAQTLARCLYSQDGVEIRDHSEHFEGQMTRTLGTDRCSLIDTPREISNRFDNGSFVGDTRTRFAQYVIELQGEHGRLFDAGLVFGYAVAQDGDAFSTTLTAPQATRLSQSNEHLDAIARFLGLQRAQVKAWVSG